MALENANYIPELDETNPPGNDPPNQLDDHHRLTKRSIKNSFPNFEGTTASPKSVTLTEDQINQAAIKNEANTFTEKPLFAQGAQVANNKFYEAVNNAGSSSVRLASLNASDQAEFGQTNIQAFLLGSNITITHGAEDVAQTANRSNGSMLVYDRGGVAKKAGFRNPSIIGVSSSRALNQNDEGAILNITSPGVTLTADILESNTLIRVRCASNGVTIAPGAATVNWFDGSGILKSGSRSVVPGSYVEIFYSGAGQVDIFGNGIS